MFYFRYKLFVYFFLSLKCLNRFLNSILNFFQMAAMTPQQEFRSYLEKGQVIESLNRAMTELHHQETPPENPLEFILDILGVADYKRKNLDALIRENQDLTALLRIKTQELEELQKQ